MSPKVGRPTDNLKPFRVNVRIDEKCEKILEKYCKQEDISKMEAVRRGIKKLEKDLTE